MSHTHGQRWPNVRFGTNLITFFAPEWWGLDADLTYPEWTAAFDSDPKRYFEGMLDGAKDAGLEGVEFPPAPATWDRALDAYGSVDAVREAVERRGLVTSSVYAPGRALFTKALSGESGLREVDEYFARMADFVTALGASTIVSGNLPRSRFGNESPDDTATEADFTAPVDREVHERFADLLNRFGAVVGQQGVRLTIHTDAYSICSRVDDISTVMALTDPTTVGLCPDAGHITLDGGDAVEVLRQHIDRIPTMHWKDCAAPLPGHVLRGDQKERHAVMLKNFRILGTGIVDWESWMEVLRDHGWSGWATEEIDMSPDPVGELRNGLAHFAQHLAPIYS